MYNYDNINEVSGFAEGELFNSEEEINEYFTIDNIMLMFGECFHSQEQLTKMAETVFINTWHCSFAIPIF